MTRLTKEQIEAGAKGLRDFARASGKRRDWRSLTTPEVSQIVLNAALSVPVEGEVEKIATELCEWAEIKRWPKGASMQHWPKQARNKILRAAALLRALSARPVGEDLATYPDERSN